MTPTDKSPTAVPARTDIENLIEALISILDDIEPDPDLEDNGDAEEEPDREPSLGSLDRVTQGRWSAGGSGIGGDHDLELDTADDEPSLGSTCCLGNKSQEFSWGGDGATTDEREMDQADDEPTFGWSADVDQRSLTQGMSCHGTENEPSLGWTEMEARSGKYGWLSTSDREDEHDGGEPDEDNEPSLGSLNCVGRLCFPFLDQPGWDQTRWAAGNGRELEEEHDGGEPDHDNEHDL
jgi:hypothetical protein